MRLLNVQLPVLEDKTGGQVGNLSLLPSIKHYTVQFLGQDIQAEHDTGENFSLSYEFVSQSQSAVDVTLNLEIADYSWALTSWDSLLDSQTSNSQKGEVLLDQRNVTLPESSGVEATYFAYRDKLSGQSQVVLYWIQSSLFEVGNSTREEHVEASLIVPIDNDSEVSVAEARLLPFASAVTEYWDTKVSISSILSLLPIIDVSLLAGSLGVVLFLLVLSLVKRKSIYRANERAFQKLSGVSKHVLSLIGHLSKRRAPTFEEVFDSSKSISEFSGDKELLLQEVLMLEKMGLVERQVDCDHDAPILTWKIKIHNRLVNGEGKNFSLNFGRGGSK